MFLSVNFSIIKRNRKAVDIVPEENTSPAERRFPARSFAEKTVFAGRCAVFAGRAVRSNRATGKWPFFPASPCRSGDMGQFPVDGSRLSHGGKGRNGPDGSLAAAGDSLPGCAGGGKIPVTRKNGRGMRKGEKGFAKVLSDRSAAGGKPLRDAGSFPARKVCKRKGATDLSRCFPVVRGACPEVFFPAIGKRERQRDRSLSGYRKSGCGDSCRRAAVKKVWRICHEPYPHFLWISW